MKKKVKVWWPSQITLEGEIEVDIPEGVDPDHWLYENEGRLIKEASHEDIDGDLSDALDVGYAGAKFEEGP